MLIYQFRKPFVHVVRICTVQFARAFQSVSSGMESLLCGYDSEPPQSWKELSRAPVLTGDDERYSSF